MQLTTQQLNYFHTFGFLVLRELFGPEEVAWITDEFEKVMQTYGGGSMRRIEPESLRRLKLLGTTSIV